MKINYQIQRARDSYARGRRFVSHDIWYIGKPGEKIPSGFVIRQLRVGILLFRGIFEETLLLRASALTFTTLLFLVPFLVFMFSVIQTFHLGDHVYGQVSAWLDGRITQVVQVVRGPEEGESTLPPADSEAPGAEDTPAVDNRLPNLTLPAEAVRDGESGASSTATEDDRKFIQDLLRALFPTMAAEVGESELFDPVGFLVDMVEDKATDVRTLGLTGLVYVLVTVLGLMRNVEWAFNRIWGVTETRRLLRTISD